MRTHEQRILFDVTLLTVLAVALVAGAGDVPVLRPIALLLCMLLVPGGALLTLLRVDDAATATGLAIGLSLALETLLAAGLAAAHAWDPWLLAAALGVPAALALIVDLGRATVQRIAAGVTP